jgi:hypothetical protein
MTTTTEPTPRDDASRPAELDDRPPILGSWKSVYALVLATLAVVVVVCALITRMYA